LLAIENAHLLFDGDFSNREIARVCHVSHIFVNNVRNELNTTFDRVISAPPMDENDFLDVAFKYAKNESIVHLYVLWDKTAFPEEITTHIRKRTRHSPILQVTKCGNISPSKIRACIDLQVRRNQQFVTPYHILPEGLAYGIFYIPFIPE